MASVLRSVTGSIGDVYVGRTGNTKAQITDWMNEEKWLDSRDSMENGFCDELMANMQLAAHFDPRAHRFKQAPEKVKALAKFEAAQVLLLPPAAPPTLTARPSFDQRSRDLAMRKTKLNYSKMQKLRSA